MKKLNVAIIGGGVGGLACAIALLQRGFSVRVYERSSALEEVGAGLQLSANACRVLANLGVLNDVRCQAVEPSRAQFKHFKSGKTLFKAPFGWLHRLAFGSPYVHAHRADLQQVLVNRLKQLDSRALQLGRDLLSIVQNDDGVNVTFKDGSLAQADLLIGADGVKSIVRDTLFEDAGVEWTGNFAWRALIPTHHLPTNFMPTQTSVYVGPRQHMVMYYLRQQRWLNVVAVQEVAQPLSESWTQKTSWESVANAFDGWHEQVQTVIKNLPRDELYRWDLYRRPEMACWTRGRVTLLGDAAHATLPFIAQGAAMALEDALVLARCLVQYTTLNQALVAYERARKPRTGQMQRQADANGELYHADEHHIEAAFSKVLSESDNYRFMANIYRYKADKVKLV